MREDTKKSKSETANALADNIPSGSQSLYRGLKLLDLIAEYPNGCPLAILSERSGLNKSTAHRLVQGLIACGYVKPSNTAGVYQLTSKMLVLGYRVNSSLDIYKIISPYLERLNLTFGETVNFSCREENAAILLYKLNSLSGFNMTRVSIGQYMPLYCSGMGKLYLAFSTKEHVEQYWNNNKNNIRPLTSTTITNLMDFTRELEEIRHNYLSYDHEENELGVTCVAAPIFNVYGEIQYAISISSTTKKLESLNMDKIGEELLDTAEKISSELGCTDYFARRE